ncbi:putative ribosomal protein [Thermoanaerobacter kivui]|uniref:Ribosomal processing cysteine protease Prp n=1 Tax=Thermoanaerobacter kivui TaxID=2325 RepID=A0A097AQJ9_THEKI|nr:ribosomal-processing cysteine protease Prp [Thermoanaerobacter kivui]AIS52106.1 putative ribosomal protein [Thermoanaerobacter kivui]
MIQVEIFRDSKGDICRFSIVGHAGYDEYGKDIVCSAVSAISQTAILGLEALKTVKIKKKIKSGDLWVEIIEKGFLEDNIRLKAILDTMVLGLKDIEKDYGKYLKVVDRRCEG